MVLVSPDAVALLLVNTNPKKFPLATQLCATDTVNPVDRPIFHGRATQHPTGWLAAFRKWQEVPVVLTPAMLTVCVRGICDEGRVCAAYTPTDAECAAGRPLGQIAGRREDEDYVRASLVECKNQSR